MPEILNNFSTSQFIPHGHCYLWKPGLVGLHIASDALIALAYYSIPVMLVYLVQKRRDVPFHWMFLLFGAFIIACGTTHVMEIWTLWHPVYWLSGFIKIITAIISLYTASELVPLLPKILALPSPAQLKAANLALEKEITERQQAEEHIRALNAELEQRVNERTAALKHSNQDLASEIAERKRAEKELRLSEAKFRRLVESNIVGVMIADHSGNIKEANDALLQMTGYTRDDLVAGKLLWRKMTPPEHLPKDERAIEEINSSGTCTPFEKEYIRKDGSRIPILLGGALLQGLQDTTICFVVDLSDRKRAEEQIKASLQEKEVLLKEIHHRVKNNLQIISSLLNLQAGYIEDEKTLEILKAGESRVASMAMIHEQLYLSGDLAKVNFAEYIENLAANLFNSYNVNSEAIVLKINVDNLNLKLDAAIHCGLIINELISNSLKYAFPSGKEGEIRIDLYRNDNNHFILTVSDNGIGFPKDLDFHNTTSLGLQIVIALINQLGGTIELNREGGTEFKILF